MFYEIIGGCLACTAIGICCTVYINHKNNKNQEIKINNEATNFRELIKHFNKNSDITDQIVLKKNKQDESIYISITINNNNIAFKINSQGVITPKAIRGKYFLCERIDLENKEKSKKQIIRLLISIFKKENIKIYTENNNKFLDDYNTLKEIFNDNNGNSLFKDNTIDFKELYGRLNEKLKSSYVQKKKNNRKSKYNTISINSEKNIKSLLSQ